MKTLRAVNSLFQSSVATSGGVKRAFSCSARAAAAASSPVCQSFFLVNAPQHSPAPVDRWSGRTPVRCFSRQSRGSRNPPKKSERSSHGSVSPDNLEDIEVDAEHGSEVTSPLPKPEEPYDFADLKFSLEGISKREARKLKELRSDSYQTRLGNVTVRVSHDPVETFPLRELATLMPAGARQWKILAFEQDVVKPIMTAIQKSPDFNQQPQRSPDNPLELSVNIEPENPDALVERAHLLFQGWRDRIRMAARKRENLHKSWRRDKVITADDLVALNREVGKLREAAMEPIKEREKEVLRSIKSMKSAR